MVDLFSPRGPQKYMSIADRIDATGDCWEWTGSKDKDGYGQIDGAKAHRIVWQALVGGIPEGMQIDHLCRLERCVNPDHLRVVTARENSRASFGPTGINAAKVKCKNGHVFTSDNTVPLPNGRRECRTCKRRRQRDWAAARRAA